jgi:hypothetical protein
MDIAEAGKLYFGLSRGGSYAAARRGDLPVIRIGRLWKVLVDPLERLVTQTPPPPAIEPISKQKKRPIG